jgi:hypothetical protein
MELESENEIGEYKIVFSSKQSLNQSKPRNKNQFESVSQTWTGFLTWTRKWVGFYGSVNHKTIVLGRILTMLPPSNIKRWK